MRDMISARSPTPAFRAKHGHSGRPAQGSLSAHPKTIQVISFTPSYRTANSVRIRSLALPRLPSRLPSATTTWPAFASAWFRLTIAFAAPSGHSCARFLMRSDPQEFVKVNLKTRKRSGSSPKCSLLSGYPVTTILPAFSSLTLEPGRPRSPSGYPSFRNPLRLKLRLICNFAFPVGLPELLSSF